MKTIKNLYKVILITLIIITCSSCVCYASTHIKDDDMGGSSVVTNEGSDPYDGLPDLKGDYKPSIGVATDGNSVTMVGKILGILTVLGVVASVIGLGLIGFNSILGSASERAANQEKYVGIVIAAMLITGGSILAKFIINSAENLI